MPALGHVDHVLPVQGVDGLAESGAGLLRPQAVLVVAVALWRFLDGWHWVPAFIDRCGFSEPSAGHLAGTVCQ